VSSIGDCILRVRKLALRNRYPGVFCPEIFKYSF
jgi:hypothetical protein